MAGEILEKQPSESRLYDIDFDPLLATGDSITSVTSVATLQAGLTIGAASIASPKIQVRISSGTDGTLYKITAIVVTSNGDTLETDVLLRLRDS